ncbi:MAG: FHA domain-containing protein [Planctomycetota bacterium]|nr:FHA domain-containing protein [Planctomycetota bacterium]
MVLLRDFALQHKAMDDSTFLKKYRRPFLLEDGLDDVQNLFYLIDRGDTPLIIGRSSRVDIIIPRNELSNRHAQLLPPKRGVGTWKIVDLNSTNGTALNNNVLEGSEAYEIDDRGAINLGGHVFHFLLPHTILSFVRRKVGNPGDSGAITPGKRDGSAAAKKGSFDEQEKLGVFCEGYPTIPLEMSSPVIVGRSANHATLVLKSDDVSRAHSAIERRSDGVFIRDLGSTNGTFLEGLRLSMDFREVPPGSEIVIAEFKIFVHSLDKTAPEVHKPSPRMTDKIPLPAKSTRRMDRSNLKRGRMTRRLTPDLLEDISGRLPGATHTTESPPAQNTASVSRGRTATRSVSNRGVTGRAGAGRASGSRGRNTGLKPEDVPLIKRFLVDIQAGVNCLLTQSPDSRAFRGICEPLFRAFNAYMQMSGGLELTVRSEGLYVSDTLIQDVLSDPFNVSRVLHSNGIRSLTFTEPAHKREFIEFIVALNQTGKIEKYHLINELWRRNFQSIQYQAMDPLASEFCEDPVMGPIRSRMNQILKAMEGPLQGEDLEWYVGAIDREAETLNGLAGVSLERQQEFLDSEEGAMRGEFLARYKDPVASDSRGRVVEIMAWANGQELVGGERINMFRCLATLIIDSMKIGDVIGANNLLKRASLYGPLPQELLGQLGDVSHTESLVEHLRRSIESPNFDEICTYALRYLDQLNGLWVPGFCSIAERADDQRVRAFFVRALTRHVDKHLDVIAEITQSINAHWVEDILKMFARCSKASAARERLETMASDPSQAKRADLARIALEQHTGDEAQERLIDQIQNAEDKTERISAARQLADSGNSDCVDGLLELIQTKAFRKRDEDEIDAVLGALAWLGEGRAIEILTDLSEQGGGLFGRRESEKVKQSALVWLDTLKEHLDHEDRG